MRNIANADTEVLVIFNRGIEIEVFYVQCHESAVRGGCDAVFKHFDGFNFCGGRADVSFVDDVFTSKSNSGAMDVVFVHLDFSDNAGISEVFMLIFRYFVKLKKVKSICAFNLARALRQAPKFAAEVWPPIFCVCTFFH